MKSDNKHLVAGLRKGDPESYKALFQMFYVKFVNFVDCIIRDEDSAKDIVQEAFAKVWASREKLNEELSIENYLYVIVKRLMLNHIRDNKKFQDSLNADLQELTQISREGGVEDIVIAREAKTVIDLTVASMPPQRRKAWLLSREKGLSNKEIADAMGLSVRTVDRHLSMALSEIRKKFS